MTVVSVSMPEELVERLDAFAEDHGYSGRSSVLREAARSLLDEFDDEELTDRYLMAVVTVLFTHESSGVEQQMTDLRHEFEAQVASNLHSHVGDGFCMELFVLEGAADDISAFVGRIRAIEETLSVDHSVIPVDAVDDAVAHPH